MDLISIFKKQGGIKLLKQYWKSGALFTAVFQFMLLGKSRTALEILRLSAGLKTKQKLEKNYRSKLIKFDKEYKDLPHKYSNKVWVCWFQGMENAPILVQKCYESIQHNLFDREIILITKANIEEYVQFPDYIQTKINKGIIKLAHLSDLLRLELLLRYGGTWIDATVFCSGSDIPEYMLNSELFLFQCMKPGRDGHSIAISSWFITAKQNNHILYLTKCLLYDYWKHNDELVDYFLFHDFFQMVIDANSEEWKKVVPFSNSTPHILLLRLFDQYNADIWDAVVKQTPFHKLSYKFPDANVLKEGTYYRKIIVK